ncbi:MAG TPA: DUF2955 domain-containing protein [Rubrivivax sp.]
MHPADKAALRLTLGMGLAVLIAYGLALTAPFVACMMTVVFLAKPGPPLPPAKGVVVSLVIWGLLSAGVLMVPLLEHYAVSGVALTAVLLFAIYFMSLRSANPLAIILVVAFAAIPVAGVADQGFALGLSGAMAVGLWIGIFVSAVSHAFFPDAPAAGAAAAAPATVSAEAARRTALQATVVVMPVFVIALTNPALYIAAILKAGALGQQAGATNAGSAGRELVGSTLMAAAMALAVWLGLSLWPTLWMLILWVMTATLWCAARMFRVKASASPPSFWVNALMTMFILLGPAIEDGAVGKDVVAASVTRVCLFIAAALYAWATVWVLERWRTSSQRGPRAA